MFLFLVEKSTPPVLYRDTYFKDCWHEVRSSLKCTPPPEKAVYAPDQHKHYHLFRSIVTKYPMTV